LSQNQDRTKFTVTHQENGGFGWDQTASIGQQSQLLERTAVPANVRDPDPGDRDGSFAVGQSDNQQLMSDADLAAVHDQTDLA
jgi:hypothetical protein